MTNCSAPSYYTSNPSSLGKFLPPTTHLVSLGRPRFREFTPSLQLNTSSTTLDTIIDRAARHNHQRSDVVPPRCTLRTTTAVQRNAEPLHTARLPREVTDFSLHKNTLSRLVFSVLQPLTIFENSPCLLPGVFFSTFLVRELSLSSGYGPPSFAFFVWQTN